MPDGRYGLTYDPGIAVPFRKTRPHRRTCGRSGTPSAARSWCCAARNSDLLSVGHRTARWPRAVRRPRIVEFPALATRPMLLSPDQYGPVVDFLRVEAMTPEPARWHGTSPASVGRSPATAGIAYNRLASLARRTVDRICSLSMSLALSLPPVESHPANPPEIRPAKVGPWLDDMRKRDAAAAARLIGDALAATNRVAMSDSQAPRSRGEILGNGHRAVAAARKAVLPRLASAERRCARGGQGGADARERAVDRLQAPARQRSGQADFARRTAAHGRARPSLPAMHDAHSRQQLSVVCAGAAAHVARRASHLRVRARSQHPPRADRARSARGDARPADHPVAAARPRQSVWLSARANCRSCCATCRNTRTGPS